MSLTKLQTALSRNPVHRYDVGIGKQVSSSVSGSPCDEVGDDVTEVACIVTSTISTGSGPASPNSKKKRRVSFSEVDEIQQFVGGKGGGSSSGVTSS